MNSYRLLRGIYRLSSPFVSLLSCCRNLRTMQMDDSPQFRAIFTPELKKLAAIFANYGHELRIAGGAVRDLLMQQQPTDIDFASTATPDEMKDMFTKEQIRMLNNKGESHGTITARIDDKENFEITTLRIDVVTDGRRAEVQFTKNWELDANRRDLTINSMFLGLDGTLYDYFDGREDLMKRRVVFVGDANTRIQEDYLRILRYFRFYGRIADNPDAHEKDVLQAIRDNVSGLSRISGERIWTEFKKILSGNHVGPLINTMMENNLAPYIGLPDKPDLPEFNRVCARALPLSPEPMTLLSGLLTNEEQMTQLHERLKMSSFDRDLGVFVVSNRNDKPQTLKPYQGVVIRAKNTPIRAKTYVTEVFKYHGERDLLVTWEQWTPPRFPVHGNMLKDLGVKPGKDMSILLNRLRDKWLESDFTLDADGLLELAEKFTSENKT